MNNFMQTLTGRAFSEHPIDMTRWAKTKSYPPASNAQIEAAEAQVGWRLPALLRNIYMQVGNGGFGPGYGLLGVGGGATSYVGPITFSAIELHAAFLVRRELPPPWPRHFLPIVDWGCEIYAVLDCASDEGPVYALDPNRHGDGPWRCDCKVHGATLEAWLRRWLEGEDLARSIPLDGPPKFGFEEEPKLRTLGL